MMDDDDDEMGEKMEWDGMGWDGMRVTNDVSDDDKDNHGNTFCRTQSDIQAGSLNSAAA